MLVDGTLVETVQIKTSNNLTLSDLASVDEAGRGRARSFVHRSVELLNRDPIPRIVLVSLGTLGPELAGLAAGNEQHRQAVLDKLVRAHRIPLESAELVLARLSIECLGEDELREEVQKNLRDLITQADPVAAFDLLTHWVYGCAEWRRPIARQDAINRVNGVGRITATHAAHHAVWFTAIEPIQNIELAPEVQTGLAHEFYRGVPARYEHVLAELDVLRRSKLDAVSAAFAERRVVIIHGASGQGKTTLAYRYLHDLFPDAWRYRVHTIESRQHASQIALALEGYANWHDSAVAVFVDISPTDVGWPELVERLARQPGLRVLVTVREEEWRRESFIDTDIFRDVELGFDREEAADIFRSLAEARTPTAFLDFEDAWTAFDGEGPLLEFVYLVTQGGLLRERLSAQVSLLEDRANRGELAGDVLALLRLVAVVSAFGGRLRIDELDDHLALPAIDRVIDLLEEEYLLRRSERGELVGGLHPIRSEILASLLAPSERGRWVNAATSALGLLDERDLGSFLLHCFSRRREECGSLIESLKDFQPQTWEGILGTFRSLLWLGLRDYAEANRDLIDAATSDAGPGWSVVLDADVAAAMPDHLSSPLESLGNLLTEQRWRQVQGLRARQTPKDQSLAVARDWLRRRTLPPRPPGGSADWQAAAEVAFWVGRLGGGWPLVDWLPAEMTTEAARQLPLDISASLVAGLAEGYREQFSPWLKTNRSALCERFQREQLVPVLDDDGTKLIAHFVMDPDPAAAPSRDDVPSLDAQNPLHNEALVRVDLMRRLFPDRQQYGCQGYGHRDPALQMPGDDTRKTGIPLESLPLRWLTIVNATFLGFAKYRARSEDWAEYAEQTIALREAVVACLEDLLDALQRFLGTARPVVLLGGAIPREAWFLRWKLLRDPPSLPKCAVDEWGFVHESLNERATNQSRLEGSTPLTRIPSIRRYRPLVVVVRSYAQAMHNFLLQAPGVMTLNEQVGKGPAPHGRRKKSRRPGANEGRDEADRRLSTYNLAEAWKALPALQREHRRYSESFIENDRLNDLDRREAYLFAVVWPMWFAFATQPRRVLGEPVREAGEQLHRVARRLRDRLEREFSKPAVGAGGVSVTWVEQEWEGSPDLWLSVDGADGVAVYRHVDRVLEAVRRIIRREDDSPLCRYALDFRWRHIVVVPLIRGRSLTGTAWRIPTNILIKARKLEGMGPWNFVMHPLPSEARAAPGIDIWDDERLRLGVNLTERIGRLLPLVVHVADLATLPELNGVGEEVGMEHVQRTMERVNRAAQPVLDAGEELSHGISALLEGKSPDAVPLEWVNALNILVEALQSLYESVKPTDSFTTGSVELEVRDFRPWAERLRRGLVHALTAQIAWASAVLGEPAAEAPNAGSAP